MAPAFARLGFTTRIYDNPLPGQGPVLLATRIEDAEAADRARLRPRRRHPRPGGPVDQGQGPLGHRARRRPALRPRHRRQQGPAHHQHGGAGGGAGRARRHGSASTPSSSSRWARRRAPRAWPSWSPPTRRTSPPTCWSPPTARACKPERPTMTLGCRGAINFDLVCDLREGGHHSGNWGGLIANPGVILANALASIVGPEGELLVAALEGARPCRRRSRTALADVEIDGGEGGPAGRCLVGRARSYAGRARLRLQRVQRPGLHDRHARAGRSTPSRPRRSPTASCASSPAPTRRRSCRRCSATSTPRASRPSR